MTKKEIKKAQEFFKTETKLIEKEYELIQKIIEIRNNKHMSQRELCQQIGMKQPALVRIENQTNCPSIKTLLKILEPLGYTLEIKKITK